MARALLITENYIKNVTPIESNVSVDIIRPHLIAAQDIDIQKILGYKLYNELQDSIISNQILPQQTTLINLLKPTLAWFCYSSGLPYFLLKTTNKSLSEQSSDDSKPTTLENMSDLKTDSLGKAQFYAQLTVDYLNNPDTINRGLFPSYIIPDYYNITPDKSSQMNDGTIYMPNQSIRRDGSLLDARWLYNK